MLHRIIGAGIGALATYLLLIIFGPKGADASMYVMPVIVGALVALLWPSRSRPRAADRSSRGRRTPGVMPGVRMSSRPIPVATG